MNPMAHPDFIAAEVAYRFERDRVDTLPAASPRDRHRLALWLRRVSHRTSPTRHRPAVHRRA